MSEDEYKPSAESAPLVDVREVRVETDLLQIERKYPRKDLMLVPEGGVEGLSTTFKLYGDGCMGLVANLPALPCCEKAIKALSFASDTNNGGSDVSQKREEGERAIEDLLPYPEAGMEAPTRDSTKEEKIKYLANCHFYVAAKTMFGDTEQSFLTGEERWIDKPWGRYRSSGAVDDVYADCYFGPSPYAGTDFVSGFSEKDGFDVHRLASGEGYLLEYKGAGYMNSPLDVVMKEFGEEEGRKFFGSKHGFDLQVTFFDAYKNGIDPNSDEMPERFVAPSKYVDSVSERLTDIARDRAGGEVLVTRTIEDCLSDPDGERRKMMGLHYRSKAGMHHDISIQFVGIDHMLRRGSDYVFFMETTPIGNDDRVSYPHNVGLRISPTPQIDIKTFRHPAEVTGYFEEGNAVADSLLGSQ